MYCSIAFRCNLGYAQWPRHSSLDRQVLEEARVGYVGETLQNFFLEWKGKKEISNL
jgi:hypothetical protein